jgi:hypothetical protein
MVPFMDPAYTYLFEVVGPDNRIVLEYDEHALILLAVVEIETGLELPNIPDIGFPVRKSYGQFSDLSEFARILPPGPARDDVREYLRASNQGLEDVLRLQEGVGGAVSSTSVPRTSAEGNRDRAGVEGLVPRTQSGVGPEELRQDAEGATGREERSLRGLRGSIPTLRDGLSPRQGGEETQRWAGAVSESATGRNSEMRGGVRELPSHQNVDGQASTDDLIEGFVLHWHAHGHRLKMKTSKYKTLHKFLTNTSEKNVWEVLSTGLDPTLEFAGAPDEFHAWLRQVIQQFENDYAKMESTAVQTYQSIREELPDGYTRKQFADEAANVRQPYKAMAFLLEDGRPIDGPIWRQLKPVGSTTFKKVDSDAD